MCECKTEIKKWAQEQLKLAYIREGKASILKRREKDTAMFVPYSQGQQHILEDFIKLLEDRRFECKCEQVDNP